MIILSMYSGATAALLATQQLNGSGGIKTRADLLGKAVGTWTGYVAQLAREGITTVGLRW